MSTEPPPAPQVQPGIVATFRDAFTTVCGPRFFPRLRLVVILLVIVAAGRSAVIDMETVSSGSMIPTLPVGRHLFVNKVAYDLKVPFTLMRVLQWSDPRRGEVVVLFSPATGMRLVKRIVAAPGDVVEVHDDILCINGVDRIYNGDRTIEKDPDGSHAHRVQFTTDSSPWQDMPPFRVPQGTYFMMGDNRDDSIDSRSFGPVPRRNIIGRPIGVGDSK